MHKFNKKKKEGNEQRHDNEMKKWRTNKKLSD